MPDKVIKLPHSEEDIVKFVMSRRESSKEGTARKRFIKNFPIYDRAYKGEFKNKLPKQYSQYYVRIAYWTVDVIMSYFYEALFNSYPLARFVGRNSSQEDVGNQMQHRMDYEIYKTEFLDRSLSALNWVLKYGITVSYTYWRYLLRKGKSTDFIKVAPGLPPLRMITEKTFEQYDNPYYDILHPCRFYPDPNAGAIRGNNGFSVDIRYAGHDEFNDFERLVREQVVKEYFNLKKVFEDGSYQTEAREDILPIPLQISEEEVPDEYRHRTELFHYWGPIDIRKTKTSPEVYIPKDYDSQIYHAIIANQKHLIHLRKNLYHHGEMPYEIGNIFKDNDTLYGWPATETVLAEQDILNALVNLRMDNIHNVVNPSPIVWRHGLEDKNQFEHKVPGEAIYVSLPEQLDRIVRPWPQSDLGANAFMNTYKHFEDMAMKKSAANPYNAGFQAKSRRTATEVSQVAGAGVVRFKKMSFVYSNSWVRPLLKKYLQLIQQFGLGQQKGFDPTAPGSGIMTFSAEDIAGEYEIEVQDASVTNKEIVSQAYVNLLVGLQPYFQDGTLDKATALKGILENNPLIKNADKLIKAAISLSPEQVAAINAVIGPEVFQQIMQMNKPGGMRPNQQNDGAANMGPMQGIANVRGGV